MDWFAELLSTARDRGIVDAQAEADSWSDFSARKMTPPEIVEKARKSTLGRHAVVADRAAQANEQWITKAYTFISEREGIRKFAYDDETGKRLQPGQRAKGHPTIGVGFNLDRKDARKILEGMGLDYDALREGSAALNTQQIQRLGVMTIREAANGSRDKVGPDAWAEMNDNQRIATASLYFNLPGLVGPKLTKAIQSQNWKAAEDEIRRRSNKKQNPGLQVRRKPRPENATVQ
jgi:GH24 family phage-related lysozyme (muramidase)